MENPRELGCDERTCPVIRLSSARPNENFSVAG
jgi:hypothetical protein